MELELEAEIEALVRRIVRKEMAEREPYMVVSQALLDDLIISVLEKEMRNGSFDVRIRRVLG